MQRGEPFLERYGGRISSEWYFPKLIEIWVEDREVYDGAARFLEATDWIVWQLTGQECSPELTTAGYKAMWSPDEGLPSVDYFEAAYPGFDPPAREARQTFVALGTRAGALRPPLSPAARLGAAGERWRWRSATSTRSCRCPAPASSGRGVFVMVIGTSICDMVVDADRGAAAGDHRGRP